MNIIQITAAGVLCAVLALTLKKQSPEAALMVTIAASALLFFMALPALLETIGLLKRAGEMLDGSSHYITLAVKVTGIAYMSELGAGICADAGESAVASKIELAGRVLVLAAAAPVFIDLINFMLGILP